MGRTRPISEIFFTECEVSVLITMDMCSISGKLKSILDSKWTNNLSEQNNCIVPLLIVLSIKGKPPGIHRPEGRGQARKLPRLVIDYNCLSESY